MGGGTGGIWSKEETRIYLAMTHFVKEENHKGRLKRVKNFLKLS